MQRTKMELSVSQALAAMGVAYLLGHGVHAHAQTSTTTPANSTATLAPATPTASRSDMRKMADDKKVVDLAAISVTGQLSAIRRAQSIKRDAINVVDSVSAEEAGKFPDPNVADALQRVPGVSVNRSGGESSQIAVRGFGPGFVAVTVNNRQMATASGSRAFNFAVLPSELISVAQVNKTASADIPEIDIGGGPAVGRARPRPRPRSYSAGRTRTTPLAGSRQRCITSAKILSSAHRPTPGTSTRTSRDCLQAPARPTTPTSQYPRP